MSFRAATQRLYDRLPNTLQDAAFSLYGFKVGRQRYNPAFRVYLDKLKLSEWWSTGDIRSFQDQKVAEIVRHAYETVPFYQRWYKQHGVDVTSIRSCSDLAKLPVLTKDMVRDNSEDMRSGRFKQGTMVKAQTSGTTGTPLTVYQTREGLAFQWAIWWRHKARFGIRQGDRHLMFGARVPVPLDRTKPPFWRQDILNNRTYISTHHLSPNTVKDIVDYLNRTPFEFFTGYPSAMYNLANLMDEQDLRLLNRPKYIVTGSDALLPTYERQLRKVFGVPVTEQYGMAEFAGNMSKCEYGRYHVDFECCYVESERVPNSDYVELILTGWGNPGMPFIRYKIGDLAKEHSSPCDCGRLSQCFETIDGRLEDYVVTPDGRKVIGMNQVFKVATNAKEIQLYQENLREVEFRVVASGDFGENDRRLLVEEFRKRCGTEINITFKLVESLDRSPSGKVRGVISEVAS